MRKYRKSSPYLLHILLLSLVLQACKMDQGATAQEGTANPILESCNAEADHPYYISLPKDLRSKQKIPLVIVIDPHGDGLSAVQKFREALKAFPIAIAGSEKLRNNYEGFEVSLHNLYQDAVGKYPVDPTTVLVAGFSGGARMALYYGLKNPVKGIIMFGAGPGQLPAAFQRAQIYAVSGTRDFNFVEQYRPLFAGIRNHSSYVNDYFRGIHSWPPERYIRESVLYCLRDEAALYQDSSHELSVEFEEEFDSLIHIQDFLFAGKALEKSWYFAIEPQRRKELLGKINAFANSEEWISCQKELVTFLSEEAKIKRLYAENLTDPRMEWWIPELDSLFSRINTYSKPVEKDYYYRLKAFLGIYLYSRINQELMAKNSTDLMDHLLEIYERVEPQSEDLVPFKAELSRLRNSR